MGRLLTVWRQLTPLHRGLVLFLVANAVVLNLVLAPLPWTRNHITALHHTAGYFIGYTSDDSWGPMSVAFEQFRAAPQMPLYAEVFFQHRVKFIYPPSSLLVLQALAGLGFDRHGRGLVLTAVTWLAVAITAVLAVLLFQRSVRFQLGAPSAPNRYDQLAGVLIPLGFTLTFYPVIRAFTLGQIQAWLTCAAVALVFAWEGAAVVTAGALAGLLCLVKPHYGLLLCWAGVRREWRFSMVALIVVVGGALVSVGVFGWDNHIEYISVLSYIARHGESYFANQSVNGLLHRLFVDSSKMDFEHQYATYNGWVFAGTLLTSALLIALAFVWRRGEYQRARTTDLMIALLTLTMASPVAWEHHYGPLIATYAICLPKLLRYSVFGRNTVRYLALSYVLVSNLFRVTDVTAPTWFNFLQSYELFGAMLVLVMLYRLRHAEATAPGVLPEAS